jgi:hypothetical protein
VKNIIPSCKSTYELKEIAVTETLQRHITKISKEQISLKKISEETVMDD